MENFADNLATIGLVAMATFRPPPELRPHSECQTLVLLGPAGRAFWPIFQASPEYHDGLPNPIDRWTLRVIPPVAHHFCARPYYPFGGRPFQPFIAWALASGQVWQSPVRLLVHATAGLLVSFRAALAFDFELDLPPLPANSPCETCVDQPCRTACPVGAMAIDHYDVPKCHGYLDTQAGKYCLSQGCQVRRSCPVGQDQHDVERAAFHMAAFHPDAK